MPKLEELNTEFWDKIVGGVHELGTGASTKTTSGNESEAGNPFSLSE